MQCYNAGPIVSVTVMVTGGGEIGGGLIGGGVVRGGLDLPRNKNKITLIFLKKISTKKA